ncbi:MAG: hypothetical protein IGQ88_00440 [Gloeomargaritaceae cyanobacterium C42_A2020_066]|nr:hypothetical protein [Gloeomargaritaceae cyanobacterium C42_A2020_066]
MSHSPMERGKLTAILTGVIAVALGVIYLLITLFLDSRPFQPLPQELLNSLSLGLDHLFAKLA